ncbi:MAG: ATP cone domain-containing protein, partial [Planctomycetota bacterium]|nr:ATP cone domain-containing protein [Planctomycetota bacterium]
MGRIRQVRKEDGTLEPFREGKVVEAILRALVATGTSDRGLAEELAGVVVLFLDKYHGDTVPSLIDVEEMLCRVLRETGYGQAAERFTKFNQDRRRLEEEVVVRSLPGKEAGAIPGAPAEQVRPWSRDRLVQSLVRAGELPASFAEEVAAAVETR